MIELVITFPLVLGKKKQVAVISICVHNHSVVHINCQCYYFSRQGQVKRRGAKVGDQRVVNLKVGTSSQSQSQGGPATNTALEVQYD